MSEDFKKLLIPLVRSVEEESDADIYIYSGPMNDYEEFVKCCSVPKRPNALLLLSTFGGDAAVAYRIARNLRRNYTKVTVVVHSYCKSAGTLLALGADELVMTDLAELGPLDVQILKYDEVGGRDSGMVLMESLDMLQTKTFEFFENHLLQLRVKSGRQVSTKSAAEIAAKLTVGVFAPIYSQIDPVRLGEIGRAMKIAYVYGEKIQKNNKDQHTLARLVQTYPDHGFVIDKEEAESLFSKVRGVSEKEKSLLDLLSNVIRNSLNAERALAWSISNICQEMPINEPQGGTSDDNDSGVQEGSTREGGEVAGDIRELGESSEGVAEQANTTPANGEHQ